MWYWVGEKTGSSLKVQPGYFSLNIYFLGDWAKFDGWADHSMTEWDFRLFPAIRGNWNRWRKGNTSCWSCLFNEQYIFHQLWFSKIFIFNCLLVVRYVSQAWSPSDSSDDVRFLRMNYFFDEPFFESSHSELKYQQNVYKLRHFE